LAFVTFHDEHRREEPEQHLVAAILRPGNVAATLGAEGLLRRLVTRLRRAFPGTPLRARLDGGYAADEFLDVLEDLELKYMVNWRATSASRPRSSRCLRAWRAR
jgi:hypothetical protein